jgi:hypothetical protein
VALGTDLTPDEPVSHRWAELWERHEAASREVREAWLALQARFASNEAPTREEMARLEDARSKRSVIEREMDEFMTTRR